MAKDVWPPATVIQENKDRNITSRPIDGGAVSGPATVIQENKDRNQIGVQETVLIEGSRRR